MTKIEGTKKFEVYLYRPKRAKTGKTTTMKAFCYKQDGRLVIFDEKGKKEKDIPFNSLGEMLVHMGKVMRKVVIEDLKKGGKWI